MTAIEPSAAPVRRLEWRRAKVRQVIVETSRVKSLLLEVAGWQGHLPGQHADIRLTGEDGYQAQRSYSIASPPEDGLIALTVERVENGEVSPYLVDELREADQFELRGPIGGYFAWTIAMGGPLCLIAAGSGIAPLMAMLRHRDRQKGRVPAVLCIRPGTWKTSSTEKNLMQWRAAIPIARRHNAHQKTAGGMDGLPAKDRQVDAGRRVPSSRPKSKNICLWPHAFGGRRLRFSGGAWA